MIQLVICSPPPALRAGLRALLAADPDFNVVAVAADLAGLPGIAPDVDVLVASPGGLNPPGDLDLPPHLAILLVSDDLAEARALSEMDTDAWGVLSPDAPAEALQAAVRALTEGLVVVSPEMQRRLLERSISAAPSSQEEHPADRLTGREIEVLASLANGLTNKQIAVELGISEHTVKFHVSAIYAKLGVANRAEAVWAGTQKGLTPL